MAALWSNHFERWISQRHPPQRKALELTRRRIYILPTRQAYGFFFTLLVLFLWSVNYSNSIGFALTFLLVGVALNAMWRCHNNLLNLRLEALGAGPVFAGESARFGVLFSHTDAAMRPGLCLCAGHTQVACADIAPNGTALYLELPTQQRGWQPVGRLRIETRFPLGLFRAWSWVEFDRPLLVYPPLRGERPLPDLQAETLGEAQALTTDRGNEDFSGLRDYITGDSPRHVAWKASTRSENLLVKQFTGQVRPELWLEWSQLSACSEEQRLEQLCQWVLAAEAQGLCYGLKLPGQEFPPSLGPIHRARCLQALAIYGHDYSAAH